MIPIMWQCNFIKSCLFPLSILSTFPHPSRRASWCTAKVICAGSRFRVVLCQGRGPCQQWDSWQKGFSSWSAVRQELERGSPVLFLLCTPDELCLLELCLGDIYYASFFFKLTNTLKICLCGSDELAPLLFHLRQFGVTQPRELRLTTQH